jgi:hypothetical protein
MSNKKSELEENKMKQEKKSKEVKEPKEVVVSLWDVAWYISTTRKDCLEDLSEAGIDTLKTSVGFHSLPVSKVVVNEFETFNISRFIVRKVMEELPLMSFEWYERLYEAIQTYLCKRLTLEVV